MNEQIDKRPPAVGHGPSAKPLAMLGAIMFVGISLYASAAFLPPANAPGASNQRFRHAATAMRLN